MNVLTYVHLRNIVNSTGAGRVARQMTECLSRINNVEMRILADAGDHQRFVPAAGVPWTNFDYRLFHNDTSKQQALWYFLRGPVAESFWPDTQIVYCTGESYVPAKKARLVVTVHDAAHFENTAHAKTLSQYKQRLKWKLLFNTLARKADMFHTVSQFSADRLSHFFPGMRDRLRVVHNAVGDRFFQPATEKGTCYLESMGILNRPYVLVPGGLHYRKNAELVLEGWPKLAEANPDLLLVVVNHSDASYVERARALGSRVLLPGYVGDEELCALYGSARVVWFPSRYEGFGLPVLEAMACGSPVVASDSAAIPEVAGDAAVLVNPGNADRHVDALQALLDSSIERSHLINRGKKRAAKFRWHESAKQLHAEFLRLI